MPGTYILYITKIIKRHPYIFFFLLCSILYLPASFFRTPFYPDELRILYIADNLHRFSDYLFPKYFDGIYYEKPPFYFWIINLLLRIKLNNFLLLPLFLNVLIAWGILSLNYSLLKKEDSPAIGIISSLFLATTLIFYGMSILVRMDTLFLLFIFLSIVSFSRLMRKRWIFLFFPAFFEFLAVFTKGALGLVFPLFIQICLGIFLRDRKILKKALLTNFISCLFIFLWLISFSGLNDVYWKKMVLEQTLSRGFGPFKHLHPFFYYLPFLFLLFLPSSLLGISYFFRLREDKYLWEKIYIVWFVGGIIILSLIRSKMPMYLLILSIPFSGLSGKFFYSCRKEKFLSLLFYLTIWFFILAWMGAFFYFKSKEQFIPHSSFFLLFFFLLIFFLGLRRKPSFQFKTFFILWFFVLEAINFLYLPLISNASEINKVAEAIRKTRLNYNKIYVRDKSLLFLKFYPINKPVIYLDRIQKVYLDKNFILVTEKKKTPYPLVLLSQTDNFYLFYKEK